MRRLAPLLILLLTGCSEPVAERSRPEPPPIPPNLLVVICDATNPFFLGAWGDALAKTPAWDRLVRRGWQYPQAEAAAPYTIASVGTVMTGLFPNRHRVRNGRHKLPDGVPTLAELARLAGYRTGMVTAMPYASSLVGYHRGFDEVTELFRLRREKGNGRVDQVLEPAWANQPPEGGRGIVQAEGTASAARTMMDRLGPGPWLLYVHFREPHAPYDSPPPLPNVRAPGETSFQPRVMNRWERQGCPPEVIPDLKRLYAGNVTDSDQALGSLLDELDRRGLTDRTWVLALSDHGEAFGDHGRIRHTSTVYRDMLSVPLVVVPPGGDSPRQVNLPVSLADLVPTACRLMGRESPNGLDGRLLHGLFETGELSQVNRVLYARSGTGPDPELAWRAQESVRRGSWKLIHDPVKKVHELYDLERDPGERRSLAREQPERLGRLKLALEEQRRAEPVVLPVEAPPLDGEVREQLEALGYVD